MNARANFRLLEDDMQKTLLPSPLECGGKRLVTVEDASAFVLNLSQEKRDTHHWRAAHTAFSCALMEPAYLNSALAALELALTLDALVHPNSHSAKSHDVNATSSQSPSGSESGKVSAAEADRNS
jgi:hypothetical protein